MLHLHRLPHTRRGNSWRPNTHNAEYVTLLLAYTAVRRSEARLEEEHRRVKEYLNARTESRVVLRVEEELLSRQMRAVLGMANSGLETMLRDDKHDQLALVYTLFKRVDGGLAAVKEMMAEHVRSEAGARA